MYPVEVPGRDRPMKGTAMSGIETDAGTVAPSSWGELWRKEDYWAIWLGLGTVLVAYALFASGSSIQWLAVTPAKWSTSAQLGAHFADNAPRYLAQFLVWLAIFSVALTALGHKARDFIPAFAFLYVLSVAIFALGQWDQASRYNLEPPLVALVLGLAISNLIGLPRFLDAGFRVEFYIKTGIVLLGATLPLGLMAWAGPVAILQAGIVSVVTFAVIYWTGVRLGLDRRLAATLGAGGAVCGVSAAIAVAGAVGAKREHAPIAITIVVLWAIVMIFALPLASRALGLHAGVAGAWIGTSEFADAAGFAAAETYGNLVGRVEGIAGTADQTIWAFTLMKVVGRDLWIGVWAFVLAIVATTRWEKVPGRRAEPAEIWRRFPKFVVGFLVASVLVTLVTSGYSLDDFGKVANPKLIGPIKDLRTWTFIFCFLSIGLTARVKELAQAGARPFLAFSSGVAVNVLLGFVLSAIVFAAHWQSLTR
jgi:uncharacterized integral membrane protein (TIGR00698 family)